MSETDRQTCATNRVQKKEHNFSGNQRESYIIQKICTNDVYNVKWFQMQLKPHLCNTHDIVQNVQIKGLIPLCYKYKHLLQLVT
jgi:hypothetical protein